MTKKSANSGKNNLTSYWGKLTKEERSEKARKAALMRWAKDPMTPKERSEHFRKLRAIKVKGVKK